MTAVLSAVASLAIAALLAVAAHAGTAALAGAVALAVLCVAVGWSGLLELPDPRGTAVVVVVTGLAGVGAAELGRDGDRPLEAFAGLIALCVLAAFAHELARGDRSRLVESVAGTFSGQLLAVLGAGWLLLPRTPVGTAGVVAGVAAAAAARVTAALPLPARLVGWAAFGMGTAAAAVVVALSLRDHLAAGLVIGVAVSVVVAALDRLLSYQPASRVSAGLLTAAVAPITAAGTVAFAAAGLFTS